MAQALPAQVDALGLESSHRPSSGRPVPFGPSPDGSGRTQGATAALLESCAGITSCKPRTPPGSKPQSVTVIPRLVTLLQVSNLAWNRYPAVGVEYAPCSTKSAHPPRKGGFFWPEHRPSPAEGGSPPGCSPDASTTPCPVILSRVFLCADDPPSTWLRAMVPMGARRKMGA
jgi:hypothetical protein